MLKRNIHIASFVFSLLFVSQAILAQPDPTAPPMMIDVNAIKWGLNKIKGEGGLINQYSWTFATYTSQKDFEFFWPQDWYLSNILYQIFSPLCLTDSGIVDTAGVRHGSFFNITNPGTTDWTWEHRRYRPPDIFVDGMKLNPAYIWQVDPTLKADEIVEFEDLMPAYGLRGHVKIYAFSNPELSDAAVWEVTLKFTGEIKLPREKPPKRFADQTIEFWWPFSMSFGPSIAGMSQVYSSYGFEGEDDLDSWFKRPTQLVAGNPRRNLLTAYYWDSYAQGLSGSPVYPNGSQDNTGDPDKVVGHLFSTQIPGYALIYAPKSVTDAADDTTQPYSAPHATIVGDLWGRRDFGLRDTYVGNDSRGRFPLDAVTQGWVASPQKGPMRFITVGPYRLTKDETHARYDSLTFVYAIGVGSISWEAADSVGKAWFNKQISDKQKDDFVLTGRDSLAKAIDRAYWAWNRLKEGRNIPSPPPPPDISAQSGPDRITVSWSYPDPSYFRDAVAGADDWYAWRVYRKKGAYYVNDALDKYSGERWQLVFETGDRNQTTYVDTNIARGVNYYYAVTALDDGSKNDGIFPGQKLESSRYANRTSVPAASFKPGLSEGGKARVVPNPATSAAGPLGFPGTPDKILFVNLPVKCALSIYTETGDLVKRWEHYGKADDEWDQRTSDNQYIASGIYILAVTNSEGLNGEKLSDQFVKFIIVR